MLNAQFYVKTWCTIYLVCRFTMSLVTTTKYGIYFVAHATLKSNKYIHATLLIEIKKILE